MCLFILKNKDKESQQGQFEIGKFFVPTLLRVANLSYPSHMVEVRGNASQRRPVLLWSLAEVSIGKQSLFSLQLLKLLESQLSSTGGATRTVSAWYDETRLSLVFNYYSNGLLQLTSWVRLSQGVQGLHLGCARVYEWQGPGERNATCSSKFRTC